MSTGWKRLSAVFWGLAAVPLLFLAVVSTINPERAAAGDWMLYAAGAAGCGLMHLLTLWVISGFTRRGP